MFTSKIVLVRILVMMSNESVPSKLKTFKDMRFN